ncbi:DsbA family oxidoreductase [Comamonadaceae bacterium M7527]|nr:DsbA family oxidoreductase [Comamonadaceae bacterium M7527]
MNPADSATSLGASSTTLHITVVSDVVCPWCFIGKRHLEQALALYASKYPERAKPQVQWSAFQLNPDMPLDGMHRAAYVRNKFGDRADEVLQRMADAGRNANIEFAFDQITRQPNTLGMQALIASATTAQQQDMVVQALFDAYFLKGLDLTNDAVVQQVMQPTGLTAEVVAQCLVKGGPAQQAALQAAQQWRSMEVQGVPLFVFQNKWAVSGAQPPAGLLEAMEHALAQPVEPAHPAQEA